MTKLVISVAAIALFFVSAAAAQQPAPQPGHQMQMPFAAPQPEPGACGADDPTRPGTSMGCGGCSMMRGMMGGMGRMMLAAPGGMMEIGPSDSPRMIEMRGEMMKAMGEIMMKYGKMMEGAK